MARVKENNMSGAIGPVVFYVLRGQMFGRIKPGERKKKPTPAMLKRNTLFGEITRPSSRMLKLIKQYVSCPIGFPEYNRLRGWMYILYTANHDKTRWGIATDNNMCQLNPLADLRHFFKPNITVSTASGRDVSVNIAAFNPVQDLRAPIKTLRINIKIIAASSIAELGPASIAMETYSFDLTDTMMPAKEFVLDTRGKNGDIIIAAIAIEFERASKYDKKDPRWLPMAVIAMGRMRKN